MSGKLLGTGRRRNLRRLVMTVIEKGYDRGPAKYFHGRKGVLSAFKERCDHALSTGRGTTFLIQGAQGAGKTALLYKCMEQAESHGWTTLLTDYTALIDPPVLRELLGLSSKLNQALQLGSRDVAVQDVKLGPASLKLGAPSLGAHGLQRRMQRVLRSAAGNHGLLLVVDEAQHLGNLRDYRYRVELENVLTSIHNGTVGAPVILLVGGLSTTENAFDAFSISRFENSCKVYLQRLSPKSARNVLRDYLTISGQVHGQEKELDRWIREMDQRTHGWPAHIAGWGELAAEVLRDDGGQLTAEAWASVEQAGRERDNSYYQSRTSGTKPRDVDALGRLLSRKGLHAVLTEEMVIASLAGNRSEEDADRVFQHILHKGMLAYTDDDFLAVPIPSMHDWLVARYQRRQRYSEAVRRRKEEDLEL